MMKLALLRILIWSYILLVNQLAFCTRLKDCSDDGGIGTTTPGPGTTTTATTTTTTTTTPPTPITTSRPPRPPPQPGDFCYELEPGFPDCGGLDVLPDGRLVDGDYNDNNGKSCLNRNDCMFAAGVAMESLFTFKLLQTTNFTKTKQWLAGMGSPCFGINLILGDFGPPPNTCVGSTKDININIAVAIFRDKETCSNNPPIATYRHTKIGIPRQRLEELCQKGSMFNIRGRMYVSGDGVYMQEGPIINPGIRDFNDKHACATTSYAITWKTVAQALQDAGPNIFKHGPLIVQIQGGQDGSIDDSLCPLSGFSEGCHRENKRRTIFRDWNKPKAKS